MIVEPIEYDRGLWDRGGWHSFPRCEGWWYGEGMEQCGAAAVRRLTFTGALTGETYNLPLCERCLLRYLGPMIPEAEE